MNSEGGCEDLEPSGGSCCSSKSQQCLSADGKIIVKSVEKVIIKGNEFLARIDTGATRSSISQDIARELALGPVVERVEVRNAHGETMRDVIEVEVTLSSVTKKTKFTISDRSNMKYPVLIGRNLLSEGFLVDCS